MISVTQYDKDISSLETLSNEKTKENNFITTSILSDSFEFDDASSFIANTNNSSYSNNERISQWSPRFEHQRKRIGDLFRIIDDVAENHAWKCSNSDLNTVHSPSNVVSMGGDIQQNVKSKSSPLPAALDEYRLEVPNKEMESPRGCSFTQCSIVHDENIIHSSPKYSKVCDKTSGVRQHCFSELHITIPEDETSYIPYEADESTIPQNYEYLLKISKGDYHARLAYNVSNTSSSNVSDFDALKSPIKPGDKVEFRNGVLVKISSKLNDRPLNGNGPDSNIRYRIKPGPAYKKYEPYYTNRRHPIEDGCLERYPDFGKRLDRPHFYDRTRRPPRPHQAEQEFLPNNRHLHHRPQSITDDYYYTSQFQETRDTYMSTQWDHSDILFDTPQSDDPSERNYLLDKQCTFNENIPKRNPSTSTNSIYDKDTRVSDIGDWEEWEWLCDPEEDEVSGDNLIMNAIDGSLDEEEDRLPDDQNDNLSEKESEMCNGDEEEHDIVEHYTNRLSGDHVSDADLAEDAEYVDKDDWDWLVSFSNTLLNERLLS